MRGKVKWNNGNEKCNIGPNTIINTNHISSEQDQHLGMNKHLGVAFYPLFLTWFFFFFASNVKKREKDLKNSKKHISTNQ